jgi:toluene monooxygenase system protein E
MGLGSDEVRPRTYSHLEKLGRRPTDYDIGSSDLLYYTRRSASQSATGSAARGFEVWTPLATWYERYQRGSPLRAVDWEQFRDPRETTYAKYAELQRAKEAFVDGLFAAGEAAGEGARLSPEWLETLSSILPVLRYPVHGLQMVAAYVGQMAPSGRIVIASALQSADEMRRVQRFAYRTRQLMDVSTGFAERARTEWQTAPAWQPTREAIEKLLVTYDWGEAFVASNLVFKPRFDALWTATLATLARRAGDDLFAQVLFSLGEDGRWHGEWSRALLRMALQDRPENAAVVSAWVARWTPLAQRAVSAFAGIVEADEAARIEALCDQQLATLGIAPASE